MDGCGILCRFCYCYHSWSNFMIWPRCAGSKFWTDWYAAARLPQPCVPFIGIYSYAPLREMWRRTMTMTRRQAQPAAAMKPIASHAPPASDPAHGSDEGHACAASGGAARPWASIRRRDSPSPRGPRMAMNNAVATTRLSAVAMAVRCHCWPFEAARV